MNPEDKEKQGRKDFWGAIGMIILGGVMYLVDCLIYHPVHPEVSWIRSGTFSSFGVLFDLVCVVTGIAILVKNGY
jgi:uncharacterized membrane protein YhaH (DUF805 family)